MDKYIIINETYNAILCKDKYSSRRYRQDRNNIDKHCVIVKTTKGRAEQERDYLNKNYNEGWEIQKVEPEEEVKRIEKETAEKILEFLDDKLKDYNSKYLIEIKPYIQAKYNIGITCKQIKDYENYYITTDGVVINKQTNEVKQQFVSRKGYSLVTLYKNNEPKNISVHRLVATAFIDNPNNYPEVNHINGIKTDNRVENLEWCSSKENSLHRTVVLGKGNIKPVKCIETGIIYNSGLEASKITKASSSGISKSCRDKTNNAIAGGYHWRYLTSAEVEE